MCHLSVAMHIAILVHSFMGSIFVGSLSLAVRLLILIKHSFINVCNFFSLAFFDILTTTLDNIGNFRFILHTSHCNPTPGHQSRHKWIRNYTCSVRAQRTNQVQLFRRAIVTKQLAALNTAVCIYGREPTAHTVKVNCLRLEFYHLLQVSLII